MILAFLWPKVGGAQEIKDLDVSSISGKLTLTYKQKSGSSTDYAWFCKIGTDGTENEFSGTLTGTNNDWKHGSIDIKSEKKIEDLNNNKLDSYPILKLDGLNLTYNANDSLLYMVQNGNPLCIQATGSSASTLKCQGVVINNYVGCDLLLDGGAAGLNILGKGYSNGIYLYTTGHSVDLILKGKINIVADNKYGVSIGNSASLSAAKDAKITASGGLKAILDNNVHSPFLEWRFEASLGSGKTLEIKDANGDSLDPAIQFTTDDKNKHFAINVAKNTGYTVWLGDEQLMDENRRTVFTTTENGVSSFSKMQTLPTDWVGYAETADVGPDGTDVSVSGTNYTVKTPRGLAWIAWVTNNGKTTANTKEAYSNYYPSNAGFKECTVTLANDISLATPKGVTAGFVNNWVPIGTYSYLSYTDYTKCFQGTFDGNGKTITGMTISSSSVEYIGLFGYLYGATVRNLTMADEEGANNIQLASITGGANTYPLGGIAGRVENGKIINCHNKCAVSFSISEKSGNVGGIAGIIDKNSVVSACSNSGAIIVDGSTVMGGGIVGVSAKSSIVSCFNTGDVSATGTTYTAYAGGIVGDGDTNGDSSNPSHISHCYSTGNMTANATQSSSASGGIIGVAQYVVIESCFATGSVSAEPSSSDAAYAGGIIGWIWSGSSVTVKDCLALNIDGVKATGNTSGKHAGRIVGKNSNSSNDNDTFSNNYASTKIQLTVGDNTFAPTADIAADAINGADTYLDEVATDIASWAGTENTKAFTAIDTETNGLLPRLKAIASYGADGLPITYGEAIAGQPADNLKSADYLAMPGPLPLPADNTETITLSYSDGKWSSKQGDNGTSTRFNGTVKMVDGASPSTNKLVIATVTGNPTLTFDKVVIKPTDGAALTINDGCALTINTADKSTSTLSSSVASTLMNKGSLTLTGKGLYIGNTGDNNEYYGLDNSGTFTVTDPSSTSVTFYCANTAIHNTGTLANAWMEWRFSNALESYEDIAFAATDAADQSPSSLPHNGKTFATTVTAGKTYRLWKVTNAGGEVRTPQKGLDGNGTPVKLFSAVANAVSVYKEVEDVKTIEITDAKNFSETDCAAQNVVVRSNGVLTVNVVDAFVFNLSLEEGAQLVTTNPLKVFDTFLTTRTLENKWTTFGSPVALSVSVEEGENQLLYAATGYTGMDASSQSWNNISGTTAEGTNTAALAADSPYLLAAENTSTTVTFAATASADQAIEIPATIPVTLGDALEDGTFVFQTNPNLANLTLSNIYVLNADGKRFELKEGEYVVKPFEAFIVANAVTRARVASLEIGEGIATGIEQPLAAVTARVWGTRGSLHVYSGESAALTVVRSDGRVVYAASIAPGDTRLDLPSGIYMIRINNITYKIAL